MLNRILFVVLFCLALPVMTLAKNSSGGSSSSSSKSSASPEETVKAVTPTGTSKTDGSIILGLSSKGETTLQVEAGTKIVINGTPGTLAQIQVGMKATAFDVAGDTLTSIDLTGAGGKGGKGKKKKKSSS